MDVVIIIPAGDKTMADLARELLAIADDPRDVRYVSHPEAGFAIPLHLFTRFENLTNPGEADTPVSEPKKRGRPKKLTEPVQGTDDTSEEE